MHIVIGILTALAGLIWALVALQRAGFNLHSLNPFAWFRRMQWSKKVSTKPLYALQHPIDAAAVLLLGVAKCEGDISTQQKKVILGLFESEFQLSARDAADLLLASAHMIRDEIYLLDNLPRILEASAERFSPRQVESLLGMMHRVGELEGPLNEEQKALVDATAAFFSPRLAEKSRNW